MATNEKNGPGMGGRLKALRLRRYDRDPSWTQEYVAKKVGTTKANLSKIEGKPKTRIDLDVFFKLADLYEVDARELVTGKRTEGVPPNMVALIKNYSTLDEQLKGPIRALIDAVAELSNQKPPPRKTRDKQKTKHGVSLIEKVA